MSEHDLLHGGGLSAVMARFPNAPDPWLDLSTGINPWPYPHTGIPGEAFQRLPEAELVAHTGDAMAAAFGCKPEHLCLTPGSQAAIQMLPILYPARRVAIVSPTYSEHSLCWARSGADVVEIPGLPDPRDAFDAIVVVNPNNPDGRTFATRDLLHLGQAQARRGAILVVDEAFMDSTPEQSLAKNAASPGIVILRSFGKFYGLAGLRIGAILSNPDFVRRTTALFGPWPINGPALALAQQAYVNGGWQAETRDRLRRAADNLDSMLAASGLDPVGGCSLFRWARMPNAHAVWERLARQGVYVRRFAWTDDHLRFGLPARDADLTRIAEALDAP